MISSYRKLNRHGPFQGFITQVYDSANFDIDIELDDDTKQKYDEVFKNGYIAIDMDADHVTSERRRAYRCRVKGVVVDKGRRDHSANISARQAANKIEKKVKLYNSWVTCYVNEIDQYSRILVDLYDPITGESMTDQIFSEHPDVFTKYVKPEHF